MNQILPRLFPLLGIAEQGASGTEPMQMVMTFAPIVLVVLVFFVFAIRPQQQKQKEMERMIREMQKGDSVVTIGGMHGAVDLIGDNYVILRADDNTKLKFSKSAIATVTKAGGKPNE